MKLKDYIPQPVDSVVQSKGYKLLDSLPTREELLKIVSEQADDTPLRQVSGMYTGLKVLGLVADNSACGFYRIVNPLKMLALHGAEVFYGSTMSLNTAMQFDKVIAPRQHNEDVYDMLCHLGWEGKTIIYENDDDLDHVLPTSPSYPIYNKRTEALKWINKTMRACHGVTTTTLELGRWYCQNSVNVAVIDNYIDFSFRNWHVDVSWQEDVHGTNPIFKVNPLPPKPDKWKGKFVILYAAGSTHSSDFDVIGAELSQYLRKNPDTIFALCTSPDQIRKWVIKFNLPEDQIDLIPPRHFSKYPEALYGCDIQIAPLTMCHFNCAKSSLKVYESLASGAIPVVSCVAPYARFHAKHPDSVLMVGNNKFCYRNWTEAFDWVKNNPQKAEKMAKRGRRLIVNEYSLEKNYHAWPKAWDSIKENASRGLIGPPEKLLPESFYETMNQILDTDPDPTGIDSSYKEGYYGAFGYCKGRK